MTVYVYINCAIEHFTKLELGLVALSENLSKVKAA